MKYLLRALPVLVLAAIAAAIALIGGAAPAKATTCTVNLMGNSTSYSGYTSAGPSGSVLTVTYANCGGSSSIQWLRDGTAISGATSSSYTTTSSDTGHIVTVEILDAGRQVVGTSASFAATGAQAFGDEFNGAANSTPCTSMCGSGTQWSDLTGSSGPITYNGSLNMGETGVGALEEEAVCTGTGCGSTCPTNCSWSSSGIDLANAYTPSGPYFVEMRAQIVCDSDTGLNSASFGASSDVLSNEVELDLNEVWTGGATQQDSHQFNVFHWDTTQTPWYRVYHADSVNEGSAQCGSWHTYGMLVGASTVTFYYDGAQEFVVNKTDCAFKDIDGVGSGNNVGGDEGVNCGTDNDSDSSSENIPNNFDWYNPTWVIDIFNSGTMAATDGSVNDKYYIDYIHGYAY